MLKKRLYFLFPLLMFILSACGSETVRFQAGDIKDDFCGVHLNYQYCKCAFHNEFCDTVAMSKGEAKKYVNEEYNKWVEKEKLNFANDCKAKNGVYNDNKCKYCDENEIVVDNKCKKNDEGENNYDVDEESESVEGECKYDTDCDAMCEGNIKWEMGCNARSNSCEKTFDTDCSTNMETFGDLSFPMICSAGECARDSDAIRNKRNDLEIEAKKYSDELKSLNMVRDDLTNVMLDANKNCLNGLADMTNVAIVEFATRVASIMAGGVPDVASASVDYFSDALNKLYAYQSGEPTGEKKLKPNEYIKLNCDLYDYFKAELAGSDKKVDELVENAKRVDEQLQSLPVL